MPRFSYKVLNQSGRTVQGVVTAGTPAAAAQELRGQGLTPLEIVSAEGRPLESEKSDRGFGKPRRRDILIFTSQLAAMLRAGMILPDALRIISSQSENPRLREIVRTVRESVMGGSSLSDALRRYPRIWNKLYCNMVQVGETSGRLGDVLSRLAGHLESSQVLRSSIFSALAYPAVILFVGIASVIVLLIFVIPNLSAAFTELDMQLPWLTTTIIGLSGWLAAHWWAPLLAVVGLGAAMRSVLSNPEGRFWLDSRRRKVPILGPTMDKVHLAQMAQTMGILVRSGIPVLTSLELASETTASPVLARALKESAEKVKRGERIAQSLDETGAVPGMVSNLIAVGEESGRLDEMLGQIAAQYEMEVGIAVKRMLSLFEPAVIVLMAIGVGTFVLAFLLPMLTIARGIEIPQ